MENLNSNVGRIESNQAPDDGAQAPQGGPGDKSGKVYLVTIPALKVQNLLNEIDRFFSFSQRYAKFAPFPPKKIKEPHPDLIDVATHPAVTRQSILAVMLESIRNSGDVNIHGEVRRGGGRREGEFGPDRIAVAKEKHEDGRDHYHIAIRFPRKTRWQSICGYLRHKKRLPSHFSLSHSHWWSAIR